MTKRVAIYARVSIKDQSVDIQLNDLERYSKGCDIHRRTCHKGGLRKARTNGRHLGWPRSKVETDKTVKYRKHNKSIRQIAKKLNRSKGAVQRTLEMC